jgi:hypothetical protein
VNRLRTYVTDSRAARGCETPRQVLDRLMLGSAQIQLRKELENS